MDGSNGFLTIRNTNTHGYALPSNTLCPALQWIEIYKNVENLMGTTEMDSSYGVTENCMRPKWKYIENGLCVCSFTTLVRLMCLYCVCILYERLVVWECILCRIRIRCVSYIWSSSLGKCHGSFFFMICMKYLNRFLCNFMRKAKQRENRSI